MSTEIRASLVAYMRDWIEAHAEKGSFNWCNYWYDDNLAECMGAAAYAVFRAAREAQDFADAQRKENA